MYKRKKNLLNQLEKVWILKSRSAKKKVTNYVFLERIENNLKLIKKLCNRVYSDYLLNFTRDTFGTTLEKTNFSRPQVNLAVSKEVAHLGRSTYFKKKPVIKIYIDSEHFKLINNSKEFIEKGTGIFQIILVHELIHFFNNDMIKKSILQHHSLVFLPLLLLFCVPEISIILHLTASTLSFFTEDYIEEKEEGLADFLTRCLNFQKRIISNDELMKTNISLNREKLGEKIFNEWIKSRKSLKEFILYKTKNEKIDLTQKEIEPLLNKFSETLEKEGIEF